MTRRAAIAVAAAALAAAVAVALVVGPWRDGGAAPDGPSTSAPARAAVPPARTVRGLRAEHAAIADVVARERLLVAAATIGDGDAVAWLADVASGDDPLANRAAVALGTIASPAAAGELAALAASDRPVLVRANATRALAASGGVAQAPVLADLVRSPDTPARVRQEAAIALGRVGGGDGAVAALVDTLAAADDEQLRIALVQGLGAFDRPAARAALERHGAAPLSPTERAFVARALAR